jgi:transcriptional regulator of acetoin/glycerol metabolism
MSIALLAAYHWPGNMRALRNVLKQAGMLSDKSHVARITGKLLNTIWNLVHEWICKAILAKALFQIIPNPGIKNTKTGAA